MKVCRGCGETLQSEDSGKAGYVPPHRLEEEDVLCRRCFRIIHYNEVTPAAVPVERMRVLMQRLASERVLVVQVVDVTDWTGSRIPNLSLAVAEGRLWLVINKMDLLPKETNYDRVRRWFEGRIEKEGMAVERVFLASAAKGIGISPLLEELRQSGLPVYFIGAANVGKSSLINALLRRIGRPEDLHLTTSRVPGTTLNTVSIDAGDGRLWVDTPGITAAYRVVDRLCPQCLRSVVPAGVIRPRIYQLTAGQTLWLGGLVRLDLLEGERQPVVCYVSNELRIHRTNHQRAESFYEGHVTKDLLPPCERCRASVANLLMHQWTFSPGSPTDVAVAGLGWISVRGRAARIALYAPEGVDVEVRPALI